MSATPREFGPMVIYQIVDEVETNMGLTQGGVSMTFEFTTFDTRSDQTGSAPLNMYYTGMSCVISAPYTYKTMAEVLSMFPSTDGNAVTIPIGCDARSDVISLLLRPFLCGEISKDDTEAIFAPVVLPKPNPNITFGMDNQWIWNVDYHVLPYDPRNFDFTMLYFGQSST